MNAASAALMVVSGAFFDPSLMVMFKKEELIRLTDGFVQYIVYTNLLPALYLLPSTTKY